MLHENRLVKWRLFLTGCALSAGLMVTERIQAQTFVTFSTTWALPNEQLIVGNGGWVVPDHEIKQGVVSVPKFRADWGTFGNASSQIDWQTLFHFDATGTNTDPPGGGNGGYWVGLMDTNSPPIDDGGADVPSEGAEVTIAHNGTYGMSTGSVTGTGQLDLGYWSDVSMNSDYLPVGMTAATSGMYIGFWSVTYDYTPSHIWTGPTPAPGPGGAGWGGGGGWGIGPGGPNPPPNGPCQSAYFGDGATTYVVNLDVPVTVGLLHFDSNTSYTINGPNTLTLDCDHANIVVSRGSHTINAPIHYAADTTVTVMGANTLTTSNTMTAAIGVSLDKQGPGTWVAKHVRAHSLAVGNGKVQMIADQTVDGTSTLDALSVLDAVGAKLDLNQNHLIIDYAPGSSPYAEIKRLLTVGRNGGTWDGAGIDSSAVATHSGTAVGYGEASVIGKTVFGGMAVDTTSVLVRYTLGGDATLDGVVDFNDLTKLSQHYNGPGDWEDGDFNYDGMVDFNDQVILSQNYNTSLPASASPVSAVAAVPEPAGLSVALIISSLLSGRKTRRRRNSSL